MTSRYSKDQIESAISYWKNMLNEAAPETKDGKPAGNKKPSVAKKPSNSKKPSAVKKPAPAKKPSTVKKPVAVKKPAGSKKTPEVKPSASKTDPNVKDVAEDTARRGGNGAESAASATKTAASPEDVKKAEAAISSDGTNVDNPKEARSEAQNVGTFDLGARLARIHNMAVKKTRKIVGKFLNGQKLGNETSVRVINSLIDPRGHRFVGKDGDEMIITISVAIDQANVKGFRKFVASILHESGHHAAAYRYERLDENIFSTVFGAIGAAVKAGKEGVDKSIQNANDEFRKRLGVAGLQTYLNSFCGVNSHLADNVKTVDPEASSITNDNGNARYEYSCKVTVSI